MSQEHDLYTIEGLNWAGLGVVKVNNKVRCVPLTKPNEQVAVRWHDAGWGRWIGERLDDEHTIKVFDEQLNCEQARRCTGCSLRHLSEAEQQEGQEQSHLGALQRLSGRDLSKISVSWLKSADRLGYRVRVTAKVVALSHDTYQIALRSRWGQPIDLALCPNHPQVLRSLVATCAQWINQHALRLNLAQDQKRSRFYLSRVSIQAGGGLPRWLILHFEDFTHRGSLKASERQKRLKQAQDVLSQLCFKDLLDAYPNLTVYADAKLQDQAQSALDLQHLSGPPPQLWVCDRKLKFVARPPAWLPQSPSTLESLRKTVVYCLGLTREIQSENKPAAKNTQDAQTIFELGCGIGVLSIALMLEYPQLKWIGVDLEAEAIDCAQESAHLNQVEDQVKFIAQDGRRALAETPEVISSLIIHAMRRPLSGLLTLAAHKNIKRICYLAPSAPSLARDLAEDQAYQLDKLYFIDQMPGTAQAMTIAQLSLR